MKKLIIVLFLVLSLMTVYAGSTAGYTQSDVREDLKLSATIANVVYFGVTDKAINSSIVPTNNYNKVELKFDSNTHTYKIDTLYFYVLSFVSYPINVTLTSTALTLYDSSGNVVKKSGKSVTLDYTASVKNTKKDNVYAAGDCKSIPSITSALTPTEPNLVKETGKSYQNPRVMGWQFDFALNSTATEFDLASGNYYAATFTMTVSTT